MQLKLATVHGDEVVSMMEDHEFPIGACRSRSLQKEMDTQLQ